MKKTESECVGCGFPCLLGACPNYRVTRYYCDKCYSEETLYKTDEGELCAECIIDNLQRVEGSY